MFSEYFILFKYSLFCALISLLLFSISFFITYQKPGIEKSSPYECGFNPFGDARNKFEVKFYLVGILFIIFDLEIIFLFPFIVSLNNIDFFGIYTMYIFILILTIGFLYEWFKGALDLD